jgi:homogentisate 1,2-dioxygenase
MFEPKRTATDEYAVMLDARDALEVTDAARAAENQDYVNSWRAPGEPAPKAPTVAAGDEAAAPRSRR